MTEAERARIGIVANPAAGRSTDPERWNRIVAELRRRFPAAQLRSTQRPGDERSAVAELLALSVDQLVVAGGDGTLHQVVDALLSSPLSAFRRPVVGLVPLGSGNDFARGLGVPLTPFEAIRALEQTREVGVDVGRLTFLGETPARSVYWLNQCYLGFGAAVVDRVTRSSRPADQSAYLRSALRELWHARPHHYSLESDDRPAEEVDAMNLLITNGRYSGSGMLSSPRADPRDGVFEVVLVKPVGRLRLLTGLRRFRAGTHLELPEVSSWKVRSLVVRSENPADLVEADGDIVGRLPARYEVVPEAVRILVPAHQSVATRS
jgi:YegS/Rv2252/BmrU family lipid kinase